MASISHTTQETKPSKDVKEATPATQSSYAIAAFVIGLLAGSVAIVLSVSKAFGPVGSIGFYGALIGGGVVAVPSGVGMAWMAYKNSKRQIATEENEGLKAQEPIPTAAVLPQHSISEEEIPEIKDLKLKLQQGMNISTALKEMDREFFKDKSQHRAKEVFSYAMRELLQGVVYFPKAGPLENPESLSGKLDRDVFQVSKTKGVELDIPRSSTDSQHIHVYQIASQYNAAEAPSPFTPPIGEAMEKSEYDHTQGPLAQRTNPIAFELVTAFLTHLGFNMLSEALPLAGKTYEEGSPIEHGYLRPSGKTIKTLTEEFKEKFSEAEYVCYSSLSPSWGEDSQPVYIQLQAAPAIGYIFDNIESDELQKYAALANYLALFRQGLNLASESGKPVVLHAAAVGGGVFFNTSPNLQWGFQKAALALQKEMRDAKVFVQLEAFNGAGAMQEIAEDLTIPAKPRIGD